MDVQNVPAHAADHVDAADPSERQETTRPHPIAEEPHGPDTVETELVDLSHVSLLTLTTLDADVVSPSIQRLLEQVERPRSNIGGGSDPPPPPGRVD